MNRSQYPLSCGVRKAKARSSASWRSCNPPLGYMRLVKDRSVHTWEQRRAETNERTTEHECRVKPIQQKLDRLDEAFLYSESIDLTSYGRQRDKLREELTLAKTQRRTLYLTFWPSIADGESGLSRYAARRSDRHIPEKPRG